MSGIALALHHRLNWIISIYITFIGPRKEDEHPAYTHVWGMALPFTLPIVMQLTGCKCRILVSLDIALLYFSNCIVLLLFAVDAMKRVEEIKAKRQNQFITNRFVFSIFSYNYTVFEKIRHQTHCIADYVNF